MNQPPFIYVALCNNPEVTKMLYNKTKKIHTRCIKDRSEMSQHCQDSGKISLKFEDWKKPRLWHWVSSEESNWMQEQQKPPDTAAFTPCPRVDWMTSKPCSADEKWISPVNKVGRKSIIYSITDWKPSARTQDRGDVLDVWTCLLKDEQQPSVDNFLQSSLTFICNRWEHFKLELGSFAGLFASKSL